MTRYWAVVPAAGTGKRFGGATPKQYLQIAGQTVMQHTLNRLCQAVPLSACIVLLLALEVFHLWISQYKEHF